MLWRRDCSEQEGGRREGVWLVGGRSVGDNDVMSGGRRGGRRLALHNSSRLVRQARARGGMVHGQARAAWSLAQAADSNAGQRAVCAPEADPLGGSLGAHALPDELLELVRIEQPRELR